MKLRLSDLELYDVLKTFPAAPRGLDSEWRIGKSKSKTKTYVNDVEVPLSTDGFIVRQLWRLLKPRADSDHVRVTLTLSSMPYHTHILIVENI